MLLTPARHQLEHEGDYDAHSLSFLSVFLLFFLSFLLTIFITCSPFPSLLTNPNQRPKANTHQSSAKQYCVQITQVISVCHRVSMTRNQNNLLLFLQYIHHPDVINTNLGVNCAQIQVHYKYILTYSLNAVAQNGCSQNCLRKQHPFFS